MRYAAAFFARGFLAAAFGAGAGSTMRGLRPSPIFRASSWPPGGVIRRHHRIVRPEAPLRAVRFRRHVVSGHQVAL